MGSRPPNRRRTHPLRWTVLFLAATLTLVGCIPARQKAAVDRTNALLRLPARQHPKFSDDSALSGLISSIDASLAYLRRVPPERRFTFGPDRYDAAHLTRSLQTFRRFVETDPDLRSLRRFVRDRYRVYAAAGGRTDRRVLFTGYFEPILQGCAVRTETYRFPIYRRPTDLLKVDLTPFSPRLTGVHITGRLDGQSLVPYYDRRAIEETDVLAGKAEAIAYLKSRVDLFFLQIQGSGKIYLTDGRVLNVHYHGANGRPYRSIGRLLIEQQKIAPEEMSMQKIRSYLASHPEEVSAILNYNTSYVFFKTETEGPLGAIGEPLTPGRSIATDRRLFPAASLCYIETRQPRIDAAGGIHQWDPLARFVLNQDTGGAIVGAGRADLFWGSGPYAEIAAGHLRHDGKLYFLVLKPSVRARADHPSTETPVAADGDKNI